MFATPSSLQNPKPSASGVVIGLSVSTPMIDHVPEDSHKFPVPSIGIPATAAAVSWHAEATTGIPALPMKAATSARIGPNTVPGATTSPKIFSGSPSAWITSVAQPPVKGSSSCEVEAFVRSTARRPVSQ